MGESIAAGWVRQMLESAENTTVLAGYGHEMTRIA